MSPKKRDNGSRYDEMGAGTQRAKPILHQHAREIQPYGKIAKLPIALDERACESSISNLNQILADTMTLRDMYKKHHWQVAGVTFYQLHLLFDKHHGEQDELVDTIAERIQILGGVSLAMAADVAETTSFRGLPGQGRGSRTDFTSAGGARIHSERSAHDGAGSSRNGRRRHERSAGERRDPLQRIAGVVPAEHLVAAPLLHADQAKAVSTGD